MKRPCIQIGLEHVEPCDYCDVVQASLRAIARWARKEARTLRGDTRAAMFQWRAGGFETVADEALRRARKLGKETR